MILVIGDIILDNSVEYKSNRISPEAPVPILNYTKKKFFLGGAANVANNIKKIGSPVYLISKTGNDTNSKILQSLIKKNKIKSKIFTSNGKCTVKKRLFNNEKMIARIDNDIKIDFSNLELNNLIKFIKKNIKKFSLLIISDYNKGIIKNNFLQKIFKIFNFHNKLIIVNPKKPKLKIYDGCQLIVPNLKEFNNFFSGKISLKQKFDKIFKTLSSLESIIVTRGEKNLIFKKKNENLKYFKVKKVKPIDVTGASDTFIAILSVFLSRNFSIEASINKAIIAARKVVSKKYTSFVNYKEIIKYAKKK